MNAINEFNKNTVKEIQTAVCTAVNAKFPNAKFALKSATFAPTITTANFLTVSAAGFTKELTRAICQEIETVVKSMGLSYKLKSGSYNSQMAKLKYEFAITSGDVANIDEAKYKDSCWMMNMKAEDLHKVVNIRGVEYTIAGMTSSRTKPLVLKRVSDGKQFTANPRDFALALGLNVPQAEFIN